MTFLFTCNLMITLLNNLWDVILETIMKNGQFNYFGLDPEGDLDEWGGT